MDSAPLLVRQTRRRTFKFLYLDSRPSAQEQSERFMDIMMHPLEAKVWCKKVFCVHQGCV